MIDLPTKPDPPELKIFYFKKFYIQFYLKYIVMHNIDYKLYKNDFPSTFKFKKMVAIDTETMGLNLNRDSFVWEICFDDDVAHLIQLSKIKVKPINLIKLLQNKNITKIFHFGRFD